MRALILATLAAALLAARAGGDPLSDCASATADPIATKACLAQRLAASEKALAAEEARLRTAGDAMVSATARRNAVAKLESARGAWRAFRDQDCALAAAFAPPERDAGAVQVACAIDATDARARALARLADGLAPAVSPLDESAPAMGEAEPDEQRHAARDWLAACGADGACAATTPVLDASDAPHVLRVSRDGPDATWSLTLVTPARAADADRPVTIRIDGVAPVAFHPGADHAPLGDGGGLRLSPGEKTDLALAGMRAGLAAQVTFGVEGGGEARARFSLLGLSSALAWIDARQAEG